MLPLISKRLIIRDWEPADIQPYFDLVRDAETMRFIGPRCPQSEEEAKEFVEQSMKDDRSKDIHNRHAVALAENNELIGCCGLQDLDWGLDFGWRYRRKFWRKGYASEAAVALYEAYIKNGIDDFCCIVDPRNVGSVRVIEKIGMKESDPITVKGDLVKFYTT